MQRSRGTRLFPLFITLVVIALVIAVVVSLARTFFAGNDKVTDTSQVAEQQSSLLKTDENRSVKMTVRGPIVANEQFTSYAIEISPSERSFNVYKGYEEDRVDGKRLTNNTKAYEEFVYALDKANMMKGSIPTNDSKNDLRGTCASGYVYEYSILENGDTDKRLWTSTCSGSKGTLDASQSQLTNLFLAQIIKEPEMSVIATETILTINLEIYFRIGLITQVLRYFQDYQ